jgi:hypothetical protein
MLPAIRSKVDWKLEKSAPEPLLIGAPIRVGSGARD